MPYISQRQLRILILTVVLTAISFSFIPSAWPLCISAVLAISGIVFLPWIKSKLHYSGNTQLVVFGLPLLVPYLVEHILQNYTTIPQSFSCAVIPTAFIFCFYAINHKRIIRIFSSPFSKFPISKGEFLKSFGGNIYQITCEELFFREFVIQSLLKLATPSIIIVMISSLLFVTAHLVNRWAPKVFTFYSYLGQLLLGAALASSYLMGLPISICVLAHALYNVESLLPLLLRLFAKRDDWSDLD